MTDLLDIEQELAEPCRWCFGRRSMIFARLANSARTVWCDSCGGSGREATVRYVWPDRRLHSRYFIASTTELEPYLDGGDSE